MLTEPNWMQPKPSMPNPSKYIIDQNQLQYKVKKNIITQLEMDWPHLNWIEKLLRV